MKPHHNNAKTGKVSRGWKLLLAICFLGAVPGAQAAPNVVLWDTGAPLVGTPGADRSAWKAVPRDLLSLEANPPKASSDPGYYGRGYAFKGDAVVENRYLAAVFHSGAEGVAIYAKDGPAPVGDWTPGQAPLGRPVLQLVPRDAGTPAASIARCEILRHAADEVGLDVSFATPGGPARSMVLVLGKTEVVEVKLGGAQRGVRLVGTMRYGVAPSFIGDDLIFNPADFPTNTSLCLPAENLFLGLMGDEDHELVLTWPKGGQQLALHLEASPDGNRVINSAEFDGDGQSFYLAVLNAPGLWHREALAPAYLEKDVASQWKRPFPARWKTQLSEVGVKTTYTFRAAKGEIWRGVPGSYDYPVWFNGEEAWFHLSKKVPPKGEALVYFLEGQDTPAAFDAPADLLQATLGRPFSGAILDLEGRKPRTHHRRGGDGVRRACTCGCTEAIQVVFAAGEEASKQDYISGAVDDMIYFIHCHVERIDEYRHFVNGLLPYLEAQRAAAPALKPLLDSVEQIAQEIPRECENQKENMKSFAYADELAARTRSLAARKDPDNLKNYMKLLEAWRGMGGAQDSVLATCHMLTRKLSQAAGYGGVASPEAAAVAEEIRARCRQCLRNPDGYEIWPDY